MSLRRPTSGASIAAVLMILCGIAVIVAAFRPWFVFTISGRPAAVRGTTGNGHGWFTLGLGAAGLLSGLSNTTQRRAGWATIGALCFAAAAGLSGHDLYHAWDRRHVVPVSFELGIWATFVCSVAGLLAGCAVVAWKRRRRRSHQPLLTHGHVSSGPAVRAGTSVWSPTEPSPLRPTGGQPAVSRWTGGPRPASPTERAPAPYAPRSQAPAAPYIPPSPEPELSTQPASFEQLAPSPQPASFQQPASLAQPVPSTQPASFERPAPSPQPASFAQPALPTSAPLAWPLPAPDQPAAWLPDPSGRHAWRHFDGTGWTGWVSDVGEAVWAGDVET